MYRSSHILSATILALILFATSRLVSVPVYGQSAVAGSMAQDDTAPEGMVLVSGGYYQPLYSVPAKPSEAIAVRRNSFDLTTNTRPLFVGESVDAFYMDADPVTNGQFLSFVLENPRWRRSLISKLFADEAYLRHWLSDTDLGDGILKGQPVTNVSWFAAKAYADWAGHRLPTLAEWEMVAMASGTMQNAQNDPDYKKEMLRLTNQPAHNPLPVVGESPANYWGIRDMHGLIWEWVSDFNSALVTGESRGDANLERKLYCGSGVVGASDFTDYAAFMRFAFRASLRAQYTVPTLGFRTVKDVGEGPES
jgi:formylglycine-generating enzyme required for sulfatase activity